MMRTPLLVLCLGLAQAAASFESVSLNGTWGFSREGGAESPVEVPHDWAIAGPFDPDAEGRTGKLPWKGWGTYRRSFTVRKHLDGERVYLEFDGVMCDAAVTLNGVSVPGAVYGYLGFGRDVTDLIRAGENDLVVQASTLRLRSRWYPGGGLYRDVRIVYRGKGHAIPGSVQIETECVTAAQADVIVRYRTREGDEERRFAISNPRRWDVDDPFLYTYEIAGERFRYGIRTCSFTKDDGFHLNGRRLQLQGVNLHADFGLLGVAWNRDAARRQLLILRDMGINAIRTSHNPTWPGMLDLCDEMGFIVWNECFDKWCETAGRDLATPLEDHVEDCLRRFVRRDRNHPSVVVWSMCNEIENGKDRDFMGRNLHMGITRERVRRFKAAIKELDPTRQVGMGLHRLENAADGSIVDLDVMGWNYQRKYAKAREFLPGIPVVYTESASALSTYGHYRTPPPASPDGYDFDERQVDSYDHCAAGWSDIADVEFSRMEQDRSCAGEFVWTGIDYLGEPTPYMKSPWRKNALSDLAERTLPRSSYFGIVDLCGIPKDRFYLYRSHWNRKSATVHLVPGHWTFSVRSLPVYVYTDGDEAELFLNGRSLGRRRKQAVGDYPLDPAKDVKCKDFKTSDYLRVTDRYRLRWLDVPYEPGELKVVAYRQGRRTGETQVRTAGPVERVRLVADPYNSSDARTVFVQVEVVDAAGTADPHAAGRVRFAVDGGELLAVGNGNPFSFESFCADNCLLFNGRAVAVVRRSGTNIPVRIVARVEGLEKGCLEL